MVTIWNGKESIMKYHLDVNSNCSLFLPLIPFSGLQTLASQWFSKNGEHGSRWDVVTSEKRIRDLRLDYYSHKMLQKHFWVKTIRFQLKVLFPWETFSFTFTYLKNFKLSLKNILSICRPSSHGHTKLCPS